MTHRTFLSLVLTVALLLTAPALMAQEETDIPAPPAPTEDQAQQDPVIPEEVLTYDDYNVKGYTLTIFGGQTNGAKYLENQDLVERTILTEGAGDIRAYSGDILRVSQDTEHYTGAHKEIEAGPAYGGRIGIYISDDFHLDLTGT
jgi:hypothetical protein